MEYTFTDWDKRDYTRKTIGKIRIESEHISNENIKISLLDSKKKLLLIILTKKEAAAIISALNAANSECKCGISI